MLRRLGIALVLLLAVLGVGIPGWIALHRDDLPAVDDADLEAPPFEGTPEDDGWPAFREAADAVVWLETAEARERLDALLRGEARDSGWLEAKLRENASAFAALERGLAAPHLALPEMSYATLAQDETSEVLLDVTRLVRLAAARAREQIRTGNVRGAVENALLGMRVGRKLSEARRVNLLAMALAASAQSFGLEALEVVLRTEGPDRRAARRLVKRLEALGWEAEAWRRTWASEYRFVREGWVAVVGAEETSVAEDFAGAAGGPERLLRWLPEDYLWQPNRTLQTLADHYRDLARRGRLACRAVYPDGGHTDGREGSDPLVVSVWQRVWMPNAVGRWGIELGTPGLARFDARRCHTETRLSLVQALAALTAYRHDHGALPDRLDALVPDYLPAVPEDRFSGEPLRWSRERGVVWSVGEDLVDDGPPAAPSQGDASAPAIAVAPAQPRSAALPVSSNERS